MKRITVYGIPRSGTNYLEFLVLNNLTCIYENRYVSGGVLHDKLVETKKEDHRYIKHIHIPVKHARPRKEYSDYSILIIKEPKNYVTSFLKWNDDPNIDVYRLYNKMLNDYYNFHLDNIEKSIIVFHEDLIGNESQFIWYTSEKFGLIVKHPYYDIVTTDKIMTRGGGTGYINKKYGGIPNNKDIDTSKIDDIYENVQLVSWKKETNNDIINIWNSSRIH